MWKVFTVYLPLFRDSTNWKNWQILAGTLYFWIPMMPPVYSRDFFDNYLIIFSDFLPTFLQHSKPLPKVCLLTSCFSIGFFKPF